MYASTTAFQRSWVGEEGFEDAAMETRVFKVSWRVMVPSKSRMKWIGRWGIEDDMVWFGDWRDFMEFDLLWLDIMDAQRFTRRDRRRLVGDR